MSSFVLHSAEEELSSGFVDTASSDFEFFYDGDELQIVAIQFSPLYVPQGSTINSAHLSFHIEENEEPGGTVTGKIASMMVAKPDFLSTKDHTLSTLLKTGNSDILYNDKEWTLSKNDTQLEENDEVTSVDLSYLITSLVKLSDWDPETNRPTFFFEYVRGDFILEAWARQGAYLKVDYCAPGTSTMIEPTSTQVVNTCSTQCDRHGLRPMN